MTIEVGILEQAYAKIETSYALTAGSGGETLSATDGIRHLELSLTAKNNREASPEKRGTPDTQQTLPRRRTQGFNLSSIMWEPSGSIGTPSNVAKFIQACIGAIHTISSGLVTTVASSPVTTGATLTSVVGLAVGDTAVVTTAAGREATRIKTIAGSDVTWDALSAAPSVGGAVVAGVSFGLASTIAYTLSIYKYLNAGNFKQAVFGAVVEQMEATFDGTKEVLLSFQGPAGRYADTNTPSNAPTEAPPQSKPASHTTVGSPASGMIGTFYVGGNAFAVISVKVTVNNSIELRNKELGTRYATGVAGRGGNRQVKAQITCYLEDLRLFALAVASGITASSGVLRFVVGDTNGSMLACVMPNVVFEIPDVGNEAGPKMITLEGMALATSGNDQVFFGEA